MLYVLYVFVEKVKETMQGTRTGKKNSYIRRRGDVMNLIRQKEKGKREKTKSRLISRRGQQN